MMKEKLMRSMAKKKGMQPISDTERDARMGVLEDLKSQASSAIGDKLKGLKKVTVASDNPHGLAAGLETAKDMVGEDEELGPGDGETANPVMEAAESMSPVELEETIKKLEELKLSKQGDSAAGGCSCAEGESCEVCEEG